MLGIADNTQPRSLASGFRRRGVEFFSKLMRVNEEARILDIGGSAQFWLNAGFSPRVTILNLNEPPDAWIMGERVFGLTKSLIAARCPGGVQASRCFKVLRNPSGTQKEPVD